VLDKKTFRWWLVDDDHDWIWICVRGGNRQTEPYCTRKIKNALSSSCWLLAGMIGAKEEGGWMAGCRFAVAYEYAAARNNFRQQ
jgi:hypothetical protein